MTPLHLAPVVIEEVIDESQRFQRMSLEGKRYEGAQTHEAEVSLPLVEFFELVWFVSLSLEKIESFLVETPEAEASGEIQFRVEDALIERELKVLFDLFFRENETLQKIWSAPRGRQEVFDRRQLAKPNASFRFGLDHLQSSQSGRTHGRWQSGRKELTACLIPKQITQTL